jgi:hypothetical protein
MIRNHIPERPPATEALEILVRHNLSLKAGSDFRARARLAKCGLSL